jgi:hypothetical protein
VLCFGGGQFAILGLDLRRVQIAAVGAAPSRALP